VSSGKQKGVPDEKTLMILLGAIGVSKTSVVKLNQVTGLPVPVVMEALRRLIQRGLVASSHDGFETIYYLTEQGYKLVRTL
jgi:predicted transcriptional regulator